MGLCMSWSIGNHCAFIIFELYDPKVQKKIRNCRQLAPRIHFDCFKTPLRFPFCVQVCKRLLVFLQICYRGSLQDWIFRCEILMLLCSMQNVLSISYVHQNPLFIYLFVLCQCTEVNKQIRVDRFRKTFTHFYIGLAKILLYM